MFYYIAEKLDSTNKSYYCSPSASRFARVEIAEGAAELYWQRADKSRVKSVRVVGADGWIVKEFNADNNN